MTNSTTISKSQISNNTYKMCNDLINQLKEYKIINLENYELFCKKNNLNNNYINNSCQETLEQSYELISKSIKKIIEKEKEKMENDFWKCADYVNRLSRCLSLGIFKMEIELKTLNKELIQNDWQFNRQFIKFLNNISLEIGEITNEYYYEIKLVKKEICINQESYNSIKTLINEIESHYDNDDWWTAIIKGNAKFKDILNNIYSSDIKKTMELLFKDLHKTQTIIGCALTDDLLNFFTHLRNNIKQNQPNSKDQIFEKWEKLDNNQKKAICRLFIDHYKTLLNFAIIFKSNPK